MNIDISMRQRALTVLRGEKPTRLPFITRLEAWYKSHTRTNTLPEHLRGLTLDQVHAAVGIGRLKFASPFAFRLRGVEIKSTFNGEPLYQSYEPVIENFPGMWDIVPTDRAGETTTEIITPRGRLLLQHKLLPDSVLNGTDPYLKCHLIQDENDWQVLEYILEKVEYVPLYEKIYEGEATVGENGFVVPLLYRIPFQQVLLEYLGEVPLFRALHQRTSQVHRLFDILDQQMLAIIQEISSLNVSYVEFPDNLHGPMTSPRLFKEYCLPMYQKYCDALHAQGKKVGSHTDGDMRPLLNLLSQSGLDVCESFSPTPLTNCTFEEAWNAWEQGPLIWGAIPSPILEDWVSEDDFRAYMQNLFEKIDRPIILGIVDLFMHHNSIERATSIASWIESSESLDLKVAQSET
jgi:hypothetical protein